MLLQPNTQQTLQDILVRLSIDDDVISKEVRIGFYDVETGKQLLVDTGNGMDLDLPLKLVGDNVFAIEREIKLTDKSEFRNVFHPYNINSKVSSKHGLKSS